MLRRLAPLVLLASFIFLVAADYHKAHTPTAMPTMVDVMGTTWRIEQVQFADKSLDGYTWCDKRVIDISVDALNQRETLVHELLHSAVCIDSGGNFLVNNLFYNSTSNEAHEGIYHTSEVISEILRRNPDLALYLSSR